MFGRKRNKPYKIRLKYEERCEGKRLVEANTQDTIDHTKWNELITLAGGMAEQLPKDSTLEVKVTIPRNK